MRNSFLGAKKALFLMGFICFAQIFLPITGLAAQTPEELAGALDRMVPSLMQTQSTAFGNFTYTDTGLGSAFSRHLEDRLGMALTRTTKLKLIQRGAVRNMDASFRKVYAEHFQTQTPSALLSGSFIPEGRAVKVRFELISLFTAELLGVTEISFDLSTLPPGMAISPPNLERAQQVQNGLEVVTALPAGNLTVSVTTTRGDGAVYLDGEEMELLVMASEDSFVNIYHVGVDGETQLIFPNQYQTASRVRAGELVKVPGAGWPFKFQLHAPFGVEYIKVLASNEPFPDVPSFQSLGREPGRVLSRGLSVRSSSQVRLAEAEVSYSIVPRQ